MLEKVAPATGVSDTSVFNLINTIVNDKLFELEHKTTLTLKDIEPHRAMLRDDTDPGNPKRIASEEFQGFSTRITALRKKAEADEVAPAKAAASNGGWGGGLFGGGSVRQTASGAAARAKK